LDNLINIEKIMQENCSSS